MKRNFNRRSFIYAILPGCILILVGMVAGLMGYRINITASLPIGIWHTSAHIGKGAYVAICLPTTIPAVQLAIKREYLPSGLCEGGIAPLLKRVEAVSGDVVTLTDDAVFINGLPLPNSATRRKDSHGRPMVAIKRGVYHVAQGEYWVFATAWAQSFDSRYFGGIPKSRVLSGAYPVFLFENMSVVNASSDT